MKVDLAILGGGGAAFAAAAKANDLGISAVLVNKGLPLSGTCNNVGCVPSKFLLEVGFDRWRSMHPRFAAVGAETPAFDFARAIHEKEELVLENRTKRYRDVLKSFGKVTLIEERARFEGPGQIRAGSVLIEAKQTLIATGSSNKFIRIPGIETLSPEDILNNVSAFKLKSLPKSMIVLGGGPTGLEVAQMFLHFGTKVTLLEAKDRILSIIEPDISHSVESYFRKEGIDLVTGIQVKELRKQNGEIVLKAKTDGNEIEFRAEKLFLAVGLKGNTDDLNLGAIGLEADHNGFIEVDETMRTRASGVWAAGDVAGPPWLETVAAREGALAVENAFAGAQAKVDYESVPYAVFTEPQIAAVGLTEEQTMRRYGRCECRTVSLKFVSKADITRQIDGAARMVIDPQTERITGFHLFSPAAAEIIHEPALAIRQGLKLDDLIDLVHVFPSYSEVVKITAQAFRRDVEHMSCCVE